MGQAGEAGGGRESCSNSLLPSPSDCLCYLMWSPYICTYMHVYYMHVIMCIYTHIHTYTRKDLGRQRQEKREREIKREIETQTQTYSETQTSRERAREQRVRAME
eukprot:Tamp_42280.p1 GENE.Tamp_42280~~Tamp_42280.p1  ORF type:complete len:105 (+),score=5.42 Tamp_42280:3-317(+)